MLIISRFAAKLHEAFRGLFNNDEEISIELDAVDNQVIVTIEGALTFTANLDDADCLWFKVDNVDPEVLTVRIGIPIEELTK